MHMGNSTDSLIRGLLWGTALCLAVTAGCGLRAVPVYRSGSTIREDGLPAVDRGQFLGELSLYQGTPYREGGNNLSGIDCSGLVRAVYGALGVRLERRVLDQYGQGLAVARRDAGTGDLVFFGRGGTPSHVGIVISRGEMVHSSSSKGVVVEEIDEFSKSMNLIGIRRVAKLR
jgi:hypothetical protein